MKSLYFIRVEQHKRGEANFFNVSIASLGGDKAKIRDVVYGITHELYSTLSSTGYTGKHKRSDTDDLIFNNTMNKQGYTGVENKSSKLKHFNTKNFPERVAKNESRIVDESDDMQGEGMIIIIPSNVFDIRTTLEVLLVLEISRHTDTQTEASKLIDGIH